MYYGRRLTLPLPALGLAGAHQAGNAGLALACLEGFGLPEEALVCGLATARWPARLQRLSETPEIWLDGGHNPAAGQVLAAWLAGRAERFDLVVGMLDTKDRDRFLAALAPHVERTMTVPVPGSAASVPAEALAETARAAGMDADGGGGRGSCPGPPRRRQARADRRLALPRRRGACLAVRRLSRATA